MAYLHLLRKLFGSYDCQLASEAQVVSQQDPGQPAELVDRQHCFVVGRAHHDRLDEGTVHLSQLENDSSVDVTLLDLSQRVDVQVVQKAAALSVFLPCSILESVCLERAEEKMKENV